MGRLTRRDFLTTAGSTGLLVSTSKLGRAFGSSRESTKATVAFDQLDPRKNSNFNNALFVPSETGTFGLFEPSSDFTITAREITRDLILGRATKLWVYHVEQAGKSYFNPIFRVRRGDSFRATLQNQLSEQTIIHWHGLSVDWRNDGHPSYAIGGGSAYEYGFTVENRAATYWYHPHPHGITGKQTFYGLAGLFIVEDENEMNLTQALDLNFGETDIPLILQDRLFDDDGRLEYTPNRRDWLMGYLGDVMLVNLTPKPSLDVSTRIYRLRVLNGSNARIYRLAFSRGSDQLPFYVIGTDGGLLDRSYRATEVFLAPAERVDLLLDLRSLQPGDVVFLRSLDFNPMEREGSGGLGSSSLMNGEKLYLLRLNIARRVIYDLAVPLNLSQITPLSTGGAAKRRFELSTDRLRWFINGATFKMDQYPVSLRRNTVELWEVKNREMSMPHPMHLHGFQFQVLERADSPDWIKRLAVDKKGLLPTDKGWKDTVLLWPGERVTIAVDFSHNFLGEQIFLFHCHNLEHEDQGMMINYKVV